MAKTRQDIEAMVKRFDKGTRCGMSPDEARKQMTMIYPIYGDSFVVELNPGDEGMSLAWLNVDPDLDLSGCSFKLNDRPLLSSEYQIIGDGEAILFTDPLPPLPMSETHVFKVTRDLPLLKPITYQGILIIPRKKDGYVFSDQQLREIGLETVGQSMPLDKIKEVTDDARVREPYTHAVVLSTVVYERGLFATVEMRV